MTIGCTILHQETGGTLDAHTMVGRHVPVLPFVLFLGDVSGRVIVEQAIRFHKECILAFRDLCATSVATSRLLKRLGPQVKVNQRNWTFL